MAPNIGLAWVAGLPYVMVSVMRKTGGGCSHDTKKFRTMPEARDWCDAKDAEEPTP